MESDNSPPMHPGPYVKEHVLPKGITVKKAAEIMGVGRPALSNFLNGNASLSNIMAARLEKTFNADKADLLKRQQEYKAYQDRGQEQRLAVRTYAPSFLNIKAMSIAAWAEKIEARSLLAALIRRLVHSTDLEITRSDFPAHDLSQRHGWDGYVESENASAWVPQGLSGWEFGCNDNPTSKANGDYKARTSAIPKQKRKETTFVFVTPRNWPKKKAWLEKKTAERNWKDVRAYDANDLEQWLEQSAPAQVWFASQLGVPSDGCQILADYWKSWAGATKPPLSQKIFDSAIGDHQKALKDWLGNPSADPLVVSAGSKEEALAFVSVAALNVDELKELAEQGILISSAEAAKRLGAIPTQFIPIAINDEAEAELARTLRDRRTIVITDKRVIGSEAQVSVDLPSYESFSKALEAMGVEHEEISRLSNHSGMSPTILRRLLAKLPALKEPQWATPSNIRDMIPLVLAGAWKSNNENDQAILKVLSGKEYGAIEQTVASLACLNDSPIWSEGEYRGVVSKLECFYAIIAHITLGELNHFFSVAKSVLREDDPSLDLEKSDRWAANLHNKVRDHSGAIRESLGETLIILAVYGNGFLQRRLGVDIAERVADLVKKLLQDKIGRVWQSQQGDLPRYAEAAPGTFLDIVDEELLKDTPSFRDLFEPVDSGIFSRCDRTGMLWALELLAWDPKGLPRVTSILARLSQYPLEDNWANKPIRSLNDILLSWKPHTAATFEQRCKVLETLCRNYPDIGWQICINHLRPDQRFTSGTYCPRWRNDASGVLSRHVDENHYNFLRKCLEIVLAWGCPTKDTLSDLIGCLSAVPPKERSLVTKQFKQWLKSSPPDEDIIELRERVRTSTLTYRARRHRNMDESGYADGRIIYDLLEPTDIVLKHHWLFAKHWVDYSPEELKGDDFDNFEHEKRLSEHRVIALKEVLAAAGTDGILRLCRMVDGGSVIGSLLEQEILSEEEVREFAVQCLLTDEKENMGRVDQCLAGLLHQFDDSSSADVLGNLMDRLLECKADQETKLRLALAAPFAKQTWERLHDWGKGFEQSYWETVKPVWNHFKPNDLNFLIGKLIEVNRPYAAFHVAHLEPDSIDSDYLIWLLNDILTNTTEQDKHLRPDGCDIESVFGSLNKRNDIERRDLAKLEYLYIEVLTPTSKYGLPNLSKKIAESPLLFMQLLAIYFKRDDGGTDPDDWDLPAEPEDKKNVASRAYRALEHVSILPCMEEKGSINVDKLRNWILEARNLAKTHARAAIGDQRIGHLLSNCGPGKDEIWPREEVRQIFEEIASSEISIGMRIGYYNSGGVEFRKVDSQRERDKATEFIGYADTLMNEMPFTSRMLRDLAQSYKRDAEWWASDERVRQRLRG